MPCKCVDRSKERTTWTLGKVAPFRLGPYSTTVRHGPYSTTAVAVEHVIPLAIHSPRLEQIVRTTSELVMVLIR